MSGNISMIDLQEGLMNNKIDEDGFFNIYIFHMHFVK